MTYSQLNESLAQIPEGELVRRLLADSHWRNRLLGLHGIPANARDFPEVVHDDLGTEGDIDILVVDPVQPQYATCVQVKRIKVSTPTFLSGKPNKLAEIAKLHEQSNRLVKIGFWQVFSIAIIVVDSRENNRGEYRYDGLTNELRARISESLTPDGLHKFAGFIRFEIVQPIDDVPLGAGSFSTRPIRMPTQQPQPSNITAWVNRVAI